MPSPHPAIRTLIQHRDRVEEVLRVLTHHGVAHMVALSDHSHLREFVPAGVRLRGDALSDGERLREALIELGPTFIKLGQVLSTRIDLVGPDVAADLRELQTNVPADDEATVREMLVADLGRPAEEAFAAFDFTPLASASVAQAHVARLHDGTEVVVKVQHAGIRDVIRADFDILEALAAVVEEHDETVALYRPRGVLKQLRRTVEAELDLMREAAVLDQVRANFAAEPDVVIPRPYPELSGPRVLTMSRIHGRRLRDVAADPDIDREAFALRAARIFVEMILRDQLFHADPHPGNVLVETTEHGIRYGILDWGEVGRIDQLLEDKLGAFILAVGGGDHLDVADRLLDIVTAPAHLDLDAFRIDLSDWLDTHGAAGIEHLDVAAAVEDLTRIVREHRLRMPPDVAMLGKTVIQLQGRPRHRRRRPPDPGGAARVRARHPAPPPVAGADAAPRAPDRPRLGPAAPAGAARRLGDPVRRADGRARRPRPRRRARPQREPARLRDPRRGAVQRRLEPVGAPGAAADARRDVDPGRGRHRRLGRVRAAPAALRAAQRRARLSADQGQAREASSRSASAALATTPSPPAASTAAPATNVVCACANA